MNNTAIKLDQIQEENLIAVPPSKKKNKIKNLAARIRHTLAGFAQPRFDLDEWRRIEYKNEFSQERKHYPLQWRL